MLVTGGAGYVGSHLTRALLARGYRVRVLDRLLFGDQGLRGLLSDARLELRVADVRDAAALDSAVEGAHAVVHLAALANDPCADLDPVATREVNLEAVKRLVESAVRRGVRRLVNASSATVYGVQDGEPLDESAALAPITLYARYKAESERAIREATSDRLSPVSIRSATACGWSGRMRFDLAVNVLTLAALRTGTMTIHGGAQFRPIVHVTDLVRAYVTVLEAPAETVSGEAYNVGFENVSVAEIARRVQRLVGGHVRVETVPIVDRRSYRIDAGKFKRAFGFEPRGGIGAAVEELTSAYRAGLVTDPDATHYSNVAHLRAVGFR